MTRPQVALASRELFPFGGGGIATYVAELAEMLAPVADVTIVTASWHEGSYRALAADGDPRVNYGGARLAFVDVPEPEEHHGFLCHMQLYSHRVLTSLRQLYGSAGPDLVEFGDFLGEGFAAAQARRSGDPFLADTTLAVRLHTTAEITDILNGHVGLDFERRVTFELERRTLRDADVLVHAGGDVISTYERIYGDGLAPAVRIRYPMAWPDPIPVAPPLDDGPLRMLFVGRCERRKGVQDLIDVLTGFTADWRLAIVAADTATAPLGGSMLRALQLQAADDSRITFAESVPRHEVPALMTQHDVVVLPSRWELGPYVGLEAIAAGVPLVGTPVGGQVEIIKPGVTGWLTPRTGREGLAEVLGALVAEPARARVRRDEEAVRAHAKALADPDVSRDQYLALAARGARRSTTRGTAQPLVTAVIHYAGEDDHVADALASIRAQTYPRIELLIVNDGAFGRPDRVLAAVARRHPVRVVSQADRGRGGALNFGIGQARGRYVLPIPADAVLAPTFVARAVALLEDDPDLAYVTAWDEHERPLGNWTTLVEERNVAGGTTAVLRRRLVDRCPYAEDLHGGEDWALYRALHRGGHYGHVIPEVLWRSGARAALPDRADVDARVREQEVAWVRTT